MNKKPKKQPEKITIHNKISPNYHEIHVDGALGGITPKGLINMSFYAERFSIPKSTDFKVENGKLGEKIKDSTDSKKGMVREYEFGIYFDIQSARDMKKWFEDRISEFERLTGDNNAGE